MLSSSKRLLLWSLFILFCIGVFIQQTVLQNKLPIETNILALLPNNQQDEVAQYAFEQMADNINNRVIFVLKGKHKDNLVKAAESFSEVLSPIGLFVDVDFKVNENQQQAWASLYSPYRTQLLSPKDKKNLIADPSSRVNHVVQQVYNPFSGVSGRELKSDPFLLFRDYLSTLNKGDNTFFIYQNYLLNKVNDDLYLIIQANLAGDAFDNKLQNLLPKLDLIENNIEQRFQVKLLHTGSLFYAAYGAESAKSEISTIGLGSLIGILLLLLLVYRSALPLVLALVSIGCGLLVAFVVTVFVFGKVHIFSLVFGASLIGVSIDYAFHYLTERLAHKRNWNSELALKQIFNAISLGLITSLIGYLGLLIAPFPGLQQLSLFSIVGLLSAYLTVVLCYPTLAKSPSKTKQPNLYLLMRWLSFWQYKPLRVILPSSLVFIALIGLTQINFNDDIRQLQAMPESLTTEEHTIKNITGVGNNQQLLLIRANSEELLLQRLEVLSQQLDDLKANGHIQSFQSVSQLVPSIQTQQFNYQTIKSLYKNHGESLSKKLNLVESIEFNKTFTPLLMNDYLNSPASGLFGFLWLGEVANVYASIAIVNYANDSEAKLMFFDSYISQQEDITVLDKTSSMSAIFADYRVFIGEILLGTYLVIGLLLIWRYGVNIVARVLIPPFTAGLVALAVSALFVNPITIFNLLALLLVLGIGIDYTLFFAEQKEDVNSENTFLAITLSAITTVLSFGLLALSGTHAIHGFGVTIFTGIIVAWLLAPLAMKKGIYK